VYFPLHPETPAEGQSLEHLFGKNSNIGAMIDRLKKLMDEEGLPFHSGRFMTYNSRLAQELAKWGNSETLNNALYQAYFVDMQNIGDVDVLLDVIKQVGLPLDEARNVLTQRTMKDAIDADWNHARRLGVTSVPTFAVGTTGIVGAQPYEQLVALMEHVGANKRR
jgi:predicted DsbA family dithiol-disulfide isomerase